MESYLYNPCPRKNPAGRPKTKRGKKWLSLVKKYGVKGAARKWSKKKGTIKKGVKSMARKRHLSKAHRTAISKGLRRAARARTAPKKAVKSRVRHLSGKHRAAISRGLRKARNGRKHSLTPSHRAKISKGLIRRWKRAPGGGRPYKHQPIGEGLFGILPTMEDFTEAGKMGLGAIAVSIAEPFAVKGLLKAIQMVKPEMTALPTPVLVPVDVVLAGLLGYGVNAATGDAELATRMMQGGLVTAIINAVAVVKKLVTTGEMGVLVPEETEIGQYEYDLDVEGLGGFVPETTELSGNFIREYEVPALGQAGGMRNRAPIERFKPYFAG